MYSIISSQIPTVFVDSLENNKKRAITTTSIFSRRFKEAIGFIVATTLVISGPSVIHWYFLASQASLHLWL